MKAVTTFDPAWLVPTYFIDADSPEVAAFVTGVLGVGGHGGVMSPTETAIRLFYAVRDGWRYDPYGMDPRPEAFRASHVAGLDTAWCVTKSVLLTAAARSRGIPARLGFADVRNHLSSEKLLERLGTDLFIWHGYSELLLDGRWFKLSTAFNIELCERFGVKALDFDGTDDALMHPFDTSGNRHMEYVSQRGSFDDLPYEQIVADFAALYPEWESTAAGGSAESAGDREFSADG